MCQVDKDTLGWRHSSDARILRQVWTCRRSYPDGYTPQTESIAKTLIDIAAVYGDLGRSEEALSRSEEALEMYEASLDMQRRVHPDGDAAKTEAISKTLRSIGKLYGNLGRHEDALRKF
eukprot:g56146.t1